METFTVHLVPVGKKIPARRGTCLIDILHEYGVEFPCGGKGSCGKCKVRLLDGELQVSENHSIQLDKLNLHGDWRLACQSYITGDVTLEVDQYKTLIQADETFFAFEPGSGLGVAVDLGTTTLVAQLVDLATGTVLAVETNLNPQKKYGSDLITRLEASLRLGGDEMTGMIRAKIGEMIGLLLQDVREPLDEIVIVGNTVMQHFFCNYDITPLSYYPFESPAKDMAVFKPDELGWPDGLCNTVKFYPSIGSFVGSDILAGIMASGMYLKERYSVLIDLGTNGEIVIGNSSRILCASTAAGPAFEGARISMGMLATTGAIASVEDLGMGWRCSVIGNVEPVGICGSGLIDAVRLFLENGMLGAFGEILTGEREIVLAEPVTITQKDIQEFQLAKAAIVTGIQILMRLLTINPGDIENVYISGGFGSYLNLENVKKTGMIDFPVGKMHQLGNTALMGARMFLFDGQKKAGQILSRTRHVNLESDPEFQDIFVENLAFP